MLWIKQKGEKTMHEIFMYFLLFRRGFKSSICQMSAKTSNRTIHFYIKSSGSSKRNISNFFYGQLFIIYNTDKGMTSASQALGLWRRRQGIEKPVVFAIQQQLVAIYKSPFALQHQKIYLLLICVPCLFRPLVNFKNTLHFHMKLTTSACVLPGN